ncbi:MAG: TMEM175 family protein [Pseudomonadota bacterium]
MLRQSVQNHLDHDPHFLWRGQSVTRLENLSDIVFALALGMLVSSASPPQTFFDLQRFLFSIIPVTAGFALLLMIWNSHFVFFRRFGLADGKIVFLNSCLLFVVLYIAYPLRFAFDSFFGFVLMMAGDTTYVDAMRVGYSDSGVIMGYFSAGYAVFNALLCAMYAHALSKAAGLDLSETERVLTKRSTYIFGFASFVSIVIGFLAWLTPLNGFAGFFYGMIGIGAWVMSKFIKLPEAVPSPS